MLVSYVNGCVFHSAEEQKEGEEEKDREGEGEQTPAEPPAEDGAAQTVTVQATIEGVCVWWGGGDGLCGWVGVFVLRSGAWELYMITYYIIMYLYMYIFVYMQNKTIMAYVKYL